MEYTAYLIQGWAYTGLDPFLIVSKKSILGPDIALEPNSSPAALLGPLGQYFHNET